MTSSTLSFAYHWLELRTVLWKIRETLKCHNFLIFYPILMKFSALFSFDFSIFIQINFFLGWTWPSRSPTQISTCGTVYYYCFEKYQTFDPNPMFILVISLQLHNFFQSTLAYIFLFMQTDTWVVILLDSVQTHFEIITITGIYL